MLYFKVDSKGEPISDFIVTEYVEELVNKSKEEDVTVHVSSSLCLDCLRTLVLNGDISPEDIVLKVDGISIAIDKNGRLSEYPESLFRLETMLLRLVNLIEKSEDN